MTKAKNPNNANQILFLIKASFLALESNTQTQSIQILFTNLDDSYCMFGITLLKELVLQSSEFQSTFIKETFFEILFDLSEKPYQTHYANQDTLKGNS